MLLILADRHFCSATTIATWPYSMQIYPRQMFTQLKRFLDTRLTTCLQLTCAFWRWRWETNSIRLRLCKQNTSTNLLLFMHHCTSRLCLTKNSEFKLPFIFAIHNEPRRIMNFQDYEQHPGLLARRLYLRNVMTTCRPSNNRFTKGAFLASLF